MKSRLKKAIIAALLWTIVPISALASFVTLPYIWTNGQIIDASQMMAQFNSIVNIVNGGLDGTNFANVLISFQNAISVSGTASTISAGTGVPSGSCVTGSLFQRTDAPSSTTSLYSCYATNTWINFASATAVSAQVQQQAAIIQYTTTNSESNSVPGTMATITFSALPTSLLAQWRCNVDATYSSGTSSEPTTNKAIGIGGSAGTTAFAQFAANGSTHVITGALSDAIVVIATTGTGVTQHVQYSAIFANGATPAFTAIVGQTGSVYVYNGGLTGVCLPSN